MRPRWFVLSVLFAAACGPSPVMITGDASAVGARVLVDGAEVGRLERREDGGRVFAAALLRLDRGPRRVEISQ